jgi:hypothetical protein
MAIRKSKLAKRDTSFRHEHALHKTYFKTPSWIASVSSISWRVGYTILAIQTLQMLVPISIKYEDCMHAFRRAACLHAE